MAAMAVVPVGDMLIVLNEGGPAATAYGVHGLTAAAVAVTAGLLLRERPSSRLRSVRKWIFVRGGRRVRRGILTEADGLFWSRCCRPRASAAGRPRSSLSTRSQGRPGAGP